MRSKRFPRASAYNPEWVLAHASGGANSLWLTEWAASALELQPGMRVLDLGCGKAASSIFLSREFDVQVWATDLWFSATENAERIRDAGVADRVFPIHADARSLPFAAGFFDAIVSIDAFPYFGTDDLYLNYVVQFVREGGQLAHAGAGLMKEVSEEVPEHLQGMWSQDLWCLHSPGWWRRHWSRTGLVDIQEAGTMPEGWKVWLEWQREVAPENELEINTLEADGGRYLGYVRLIARRLEGNRLEDYCWPDTMKSAPVDYSYRPLLRENVDNGA